MEYNDYSDSLIKPTVPSYVQSFDSAHYTQLKTLSYAILKLAIELLSLKK